MTPNINQERCPLHWKSRRIQFFFPFSDLSCFLSFLLNYLFVHFILLYSSCNCSLYFYLYVVQNLQSVPSLTFVPRKSQRSLSVSPDSGHSPDDFMWRPELPIKQLYYEKKTQIDFPSKLVWSPNAQERKKIYI